ncbi:hypothetical protein EPI10_016027 [Gossypium australe]|uniref:Retrovirus-related Pol polyprotein from transposon RE2 n=1 Tax=Gossypium australe TaxID=47621 RepID=A0A5B6VMH1_9ROSI|nr:hypothetical protein EPI10_016027 [Gossypium australe]
MQAPTTVHLVVTIDFGLVFCPFDRLSLVGYANANWGLDFDDHWSTTGYCVYFRHTPVSWSSKKQQAEYRSLVAATSDVTWLISLLQELHLCSADLPSIWCDNSSAVVVVANLVLHFKFKHVELDLFFVLEKVANGSLVVGEVLACNQAADILTKPLSILSFVRFHNFLRILPVEKLGEC